MAKTKVDKAIFPYSWLEACAPGGGLAWGLGCRICRLCYNPNGNNEHGGPWAQLDVRGSIQKCNIQKTPKKHSSQTSAQAAFIQTIAGCDHNSVVQAVVMAPPLEHFIALLRQLKESHSKLGRKGNAMAWCLFEALRDDECKFLATEDFVQAAYSPSGSLAGARAGAVWPCNWQPGKASGPLPRAGVVGN